MNMGCKIPCTKELIFDRNSVLRPVSFMISYLDRYPMAYLSVVKLAVLKISPIMPGFTLPGLMGESMESQVT